MPAATQQVDEEVVDQDVDGAADADSDTPNGSDEDGSGSTAADAGKGGDEYFLTVNDRTRYKTQEDAVSAYNEAGDRISQLSPYAETAEKYGIAEPTVLEDVLKDYIRLRDQANRQVKQEDAGAPTRDISQAAKNDLNEKDAANLEYLKKIGFTPAEALQKVIEERIGKLEKQFTDRFGSVEGSLQAQQSAARQQVIESGQSYLAQQLESKGYSTDPEVRQLLEDSITNRIEATSYDSKGRLIPGSDAEKFMKGGASMQEVVARQLDRVLAAMNKAKIQADAKVQDARQTKVKGATKTLPKGSQHKVEDKNAGKERKQPIRPGAGGIFLDPKVHDRAYELISGQKSDE